MRIKSIAHDALPGYHLLSLCLSSLSVVNGDGERVVNPGAYQLFVGGQQPINGTSTEGVLSVHFTVMGSSPSKTSDCPQAKKCMACFPQ